MPETIADTSGPKECLVQGPNGLETAGYRQFPIEMRFSSLRSQLDLALGLGGHRGAIDPLKHHATTGNREIRAIRRSLD